MDTSSINDINSSKIDQIQQNLQTHKNELNRLKQQLGESNEPNKEVLQQIFAKEEEIEKEEIAIEKLEDKIDDNPDNIETVPETEIPQEQAVDEARSAWKPKNTGSVLYDDPEIAPYVQECLNLMAEKGIYEATYHAKSLAKLHKLAILDAFHDFIIDKWKDLEAGNFIPKLDL